MKKSLLARAAASASVVAVLLFGFAPAAEAATPAATAATRSASAIQVPSKLGGDDGSADSKSAEACEKKVVGADSSPMLPVTRWAGATSQMHSRVDGGVIGINLELIQRNTVQNGGMAIGNFMWTTGAQLASFAIDFCILGSAGGAADSIGATIGRSLMSPGNGLLAGLVFIGVIGVLFAGHRRGGVVLWKPMFMKAIIVACFIFMVVASGNSHGGGFKAPGATEAETGPYKPGIGSPGWIVTTLNKTVSSLASGPAAALSIGGAPEDVSNGSATSCTTYVNALKGEYKAMYDDGTGKMSAGIPLILSSMWETTGLQSWRVAQFGSAQDGESMNNRAWCHLLEQNTGIPVAGTYNGDRNSIQNIMRRALAASGHTAPNYTDSMWRSSAFNTLGDNVKQDRSMVAWATCELANGQDPTKDGSWSVATFNKGDKEAKAKPGDCVKFFTQEDDPLGNFDWSDSGAEVAKRTNVPGQEAAAQNVRDFIRTLHGNETSTGMMSIFAYNISALGMLIVFGATALAIIVAKTAMVVMIVILFFMMLQALMPAADMSKIGGAIKTLLGMNLFVFGIQLVFAFITVFTKLLQTVGTAMLGGESSLISILWSGLAPLAAVGILHMMFTKVMKIPSPFSISGGLSWGNAMGAGAGGAAFAGMSSLLERGQSRVRGRAAGAVKGGGRAVLNKAGLRGRPVTAGAGAGGRRNVAAPGGEIGGKQILAGANVESARRKTKGLKGGETGSTSDESTAAEGADTTAAEPMETMSTAAPAAAGKMDHTLLSTSRVANSQLHKGIKNGAERRVVKQMQADEAKAAMQAKRDRDAAMGIEKRNRMQKAGDNISGAMHNLRQNPVGFTRQAAGTGAKKAAGNAALAVGLLATTGLAAPVIFAGVKVGQHAYKERQKNRAKTDEATVQYRAEMEKAKMRRGGGAASGGGRQQAPAGGTQTSRRSQVGDVQEAGTGRPVSTNTAQMPAVTRVGPVPTETARPESAAPARP